MFPNMVDMYQCRIIFAKVLRRVIGPFVPKQQQLPFNYLLSLIRRDCEAELKNLQLVVAKNNSVAVDVGANEGHYSYKLSKLFAKVFSFEINSRLTKNLIAYQGNIEVINKGLSSKERKATLYIPIKNGFHLTGWASLSPGNFPNVNEHEEIDAYLCTLDSFKLEKIAFIKIDVEGHEIEVLQGAIETIKKCRPIILVEIKKKNENEVFSFLNSLEYSRCRLEDLIDCKGERENFFFFPI